jgi:hypothetical protein
VQRHLWFFLLLFPFAGLTQTPILERPITLTLENEPLSSALSKIGTTAGFSFSYSPAAISSPQRVTLQLENRTVRDALNQIFQGSVNYKSRTNHIILTKVNIPAQKADAFITINGYIQQVGTDIKIANASVYDKISLQSTTSDAYGYFKLELEKKKDSILLFVSKLNYYDTSLVITETTDRYLTIPLRAEVIPVVSEVEYPLDPMDTVDQLTPSEIDSIFRSELSMPYRKRPNILNIRDTLYRDIQISFLPFLGSNEGLSGNVINNYSINMLGGYSLGTRQIELGFFVNIDRGDVRWLQLAGFTNLVGGRMNGFQGAGFVNINGGETTAVQTAGFGNINLKNANGVQLAGFANINTQKADGVLAAGFANFAKGSSHGVQVAGFSNVQIKNYTGSQFAGVANIATHTIDGTQIAGVFNYGKKVSGTQIGLVNIADSLSGVPVGLVSIVRHGYHQIEASADEVFYTNLAFRTGVRKFYNILLAGIQPQVPRGSENVWTFGYGLGTARKLSRWLHFNVDITSQHITKGNFTDALSLLNKVHVGLDWRLGKNFSIYTGATLNGYLTDTRYPDYPRLFYDYQPNLFYDQTIGAHTQLKMWLGGKVALRFL